MSEFKKLLTTSEIAKILQMHPQCVRDQAKLGLLPAYKIGSHWRFKLEEVERKLQINALKATEKAFTTQIR